MPDNPYLGEVTMFAGNYAPRGWAFCDGQMLAIADYNALFSLLGTMYGGDGRTTFALPDLRGRAPVHSGNGNQGPGLRAIRTGEKGGHEEHTLNVNQIPAHAHPHTHTATLHAEGRIANETQSNGNMLATSKAGSEIYRPQDSGRDDRTLAAESIVLQQDSTSAGGGQAFGIRNPYLGVNFIIALEGLYPPRD